MLLIQKRQHSENTIVAMDYTGDILIVLLVFSSNSAETNDEMQKIAQEFLLYYQNSNDIRLKSRIICTCKSSLWFRETLTLTPEQGTLLDKNTKAFLEMD
jgi:Zn-dependent oligopeptidase